MEEEKKENINLLKEIRISWPIILSIVAIIVGWTNLSNRITANEAQANENMESLKAINQIQIDIATIKKDVDFIKQSIR